MELVEAALHIPHEVPNDRPRVTYAMDSIDSKDPDVLAADANVRADEQGLRSTLELMVAYKYHPAMPCHEEESEQGQGDQRLHDKCRSHP